MQHVTASAPKPITQERFQQFFDSLPGGATPAPTVESESTILDGVEAMAALISMQAAREGLVKFLHDLSPQLGLKQAKFLT